MRLEIRANKAVVSKAVSASYGFEDSTGDVVMRTSASDSTAIEKNTVALMIQALTDNPTRTVAEVRAKLSRGGGNLGTTNSVVARLRTIEWDGDPATLMTFRATHEADLAPRVRSLEAELRQRDGEARELRAILDTATDGVAVLDAPVQMRRENEALRAAAGKAGDDDLEPLLQAAASAWPPNTPVQAFQYDSGSLTLAVPGWAPPQIEQFRSVLMAAGWHVEVAESRIVVSRGSRP